MTKKIIIYDRNYDNYEWINCENNLVIKFDCCPFLHKLFNNDVMNDNFNIISSDVRNMSFIPGILVLNGKTYGKFKNKKLYKCVPNNSKLPIFLVPFEDKKVSFNKNIKNKFVTFMFNNWDNTHPEGRIIETIGNINELPNFYNYQLYCKNINHSINKFTKQSISALKQKSESSFIKEMLNEQPIIKDRRKNKIFTIDPNDCIDYDDAIEITCIENNKTKISIYIANVALWLDKLELWNSLTDRISTIYLPNKKLSMLPAILSDDICSLQEKKDKLTYHIDIEIFKNKINSVTYGTSIINIYKNYQYEEKELLQDKNYILMFNTVNNLKEEYKYLDNILDSHDVIAYLMLFMNIECAKTLSTFKNGIYRTAKVNHASDTNNNDNNELINLPPKIQNFFKIWKNTNSKYIVYSNNHDELNHEFIENADIYVHITSPIRRLVDLLNSIQLQMNCGLIHLSKEAIHFYEKWTTHNKLEYINITTKSIKKVQNNCSLLHDIHQNTHLNIQIGYVFNKTETTKKNITNDKNNDIKLYKYDVYLPNLKLTSTITVSHNLKNYEKQEFKIYMFDNAESLKKKIKLQII